MQNQYQGERNMYNTKSRYQGVQENLGFWVVNGLLAAGCLGAFLILSGCETFKGVGKDLENTGKNIQDVLTNNHK